MASLKEQLHSQRLDALERQPETLPSYQLTFWAHEMMWPGYIQSGGNEGRKEAVASQQWLPISKQLVSISSQNPFVFHGILERDHGRMDLHILLELFYSSHWRQSRARERMIPYRRQLYRHIQLVKDAMRWRGQMLQRQQL